MENCVCAFFLCIIPLASIEAMASQQYNGRMRGKKSQETGGEAQMMRIDAAISGATIKRNGIKSN